MRRHALLIGYSGWDINGQERLNTSLDIENYKSFLMSLNGGAWLHSDIEEENEITVIQDKSLEEINDTIEEIQKEQYDVVFTVFSGHGDYDDIENYCRRLEVSKKDCILETDLLKFADRQILILDSCSGLRSEEKAVRSNSINDGYTLLQGTREFYIARKKYEELCLSCIPQTLRFYAAEAGNYANDTSMGGLYSRALLKTLRFATEELNIFQAHNKAAEIVRKETLNNQKPDYTVPKIHNFLPGTLAIRQPIYS